MVDNFLKKHLQGYAEKDGYCSGKYNGSITTLVESYMAVTNSVFRRASAHHRGTSKRLKQDSKKAKSLWFSHMNSWIPIPFNGYPFEIIGTETWNCGIEADEEVIKSFKTSRKRKLSTSTPCPASIQVRTVKLYTDYMIKNNGKQSESRKKQDKVRALIFEKLKQGEEPSSKVVCYCRFPLEPAHLYHKPSVSDITRNRLDRRVANKIKELAKSGIYDLDDLQLTISDFVKTTLFGHLEANELPHPENTRYFPTKRVIHNHVVAAVGPMKKIHVNTMKSIQSTPVVVNMENSDLTANGENKSRGVGVGLIAVHAGAGFHSEERWPGYQRVCDEACWMAASCLKGGGTAGEAVTVAVKVLEDSELTNAGFGSNLTEDGRVECDAAVMDASSTSDRCPTFGAVTGVTCVRNPVCAAYQVARQQVEEPKLSLGRVPPCVMSGVGAENWSRAHRVEMCEKKNLLSESSKQVWQKYSRKLFENLRKSSQEDKLENEVALSQRFLFNFDEDVEINAPTQLILAPQYSHRLDTVGAIAVDVHGGVASAISSGGLLMKLPGRIGQAAMYGCGCWAESGDGSVPSVAVTTSGCGEQLMYTSAAKKCAENLRSKEEPYSAMQETLLQDVLNSPYLPRDAEKQVGILALHQAEDEEKSILELIWGHTTRSMVVAHMSTRDFKPEVILSRLPGNATPGKSVSVSGTWLKVATETNSADQSQRSVENQSSYSNQDDSAITQNPSGPASLTSAPQCDGTYDSFTLDGDIALMYVSTEVDGISMQQCVANLSDDYNRKIDESFEKEIDVRWEERLEKNPRLFNALKFRIHSVEENGETLQFNLGLTCYKDYMETNWSRDVDSLRDNGSRDFDNSQAYLSEALGVAGIVATSDDQVVFQRRNHWVAEGAGELDVPGGHPEPTEVGDVTDQQPSIELSRLNPDDVIKEIFTSQLKEVRDELNVPLDCLSEPKLLGLVRTVRSGGRPICYFYVRCSLSANEIEEAFKKGGAETDESTQLIYKREKDLIRLERDSPDFWSELCPNAKAAVSLFSILKQVKQGNSPFQLR